MVSVIITTKNEEKNIENCLLSIQGQKFPKSQIEIIVVDNHSTDDTTTITRKYTHQIYQKGPERSAQRNYGARKAKGKYYLYLDADMALSPSVIEECVKKMEKNKEFVALYIPEIIIGEGFWLKARRFERSFYNSTVIDCVRFIRISKFRVIGGFDDAMSGPEDWDFDKRIRLIGKTSIIKAPLYHNETGFSLSEYLSKKSYYSKSLKKYIKKWGRDDPDIRKQLGLWYRYIGVFTERGKWQRSLRHPFLTIKMLILRVLVGIQYIISKIK
ncbi:hypothetical protein A3G67_03180 [Candidatus Roizmanbacteria bacterium RIFCSPLOWO2_12_FULL_40_12]|uniref:Glycosyltransferase 2-like domain-containing protein n=1 Tax=Candidatus Roizmanbacteria bacterium RIFCSPLOWO2_01_FULL_40_42 TaxID=1802066 RepID=A0A1F7J5U5_9BACT|nr:MAG: hypothetical protein A2779_02815 [Candidatus Roizmanbacteria bacterium RIFCSPHIGHO2_01_FULL_40_98]OGK28417.1 MAG: hypothetical protein A3C31_00180 [Candidatus Roizmanbacteria bacterium RIFCSPHIGHO2_02_FULL_40_53]OGK30653.1 MAG: hypothetical protein A2W49_02865 [Candidatus Roizmanbacteria bacterium RIFCSPHIGHO2_12_41_18]OGK37042.1 MAG: hypothetical protein A3E69_00440 [Candidatus Roizmanbacteria bacterium RIFCSPHIGHO2_12_FULL_40_130]OGK50973.1 MAG: hypothetical protein A3B50_00950 [Candi